MNSNQRSEGNNQSNNGGNELDVSSSRAFSKGDPTEKRQAQGQAQPGERPSSDAAGDKSKRPRGDSQSADEELDEDASLSSAVKRPAATPSSQEREYQQSNAGRRPRGAPD